MRAAEMRVSSRWTRNRLDGRLKRRLESRNKSSRSLRVKSDTLPAAAFQVIPELSRRYLAAQKSLGRFASNCATETQRGNFPCNFRNNSSCCFAKMILLAHWERPARQMRSLWKTSAINKPLGSPRVQFIAKPSLRVNSPLIFRYHLAFL